MHIHSSPDPYGAYYRPAVSEDFIRGIEKALNGEYSAISCYERLARLAPNMEHKNLITEIRKDEIGHFRKFSELYVSLTGKQPAPHIIETCPEEYRAVVLSAFKDEHVTVDSYLRLSDEAPNRETRDLLRRIAADEQQHAVWFLSILTLHERSF